ncbi:hypothetical protein JL722_7184 [Aureococcus anophagefferens]|nr:hypothetical protein JL722_7184 [Aureococcus anophagefferens]
MVRLVLRVAALGLALVAWADDDDNYRTKKVISCVGDSITYGEEDGAGYLSYPTQLWDKLGRDRFVVKNFGKSGSTAMATKDAYRTKSSGVTYEAALASEPDVVVLQLGTNDAKVVYWNATVFAEALAGLAREFRALASRPRVILSAPPPYPGTSSKWGDPDESPINSELPAVVEAVAADLRMDFCSAYAAFGAYAGVDDDMFDDSVHPNGAGYDVLSDAVAAVILQNWTWTYAPTYGPTPRATRIFNTTSM